MPNAWTLYPAVDDLDATCARITEAGSPSSPIHRKAAFSVVQLPAK